MESQEADSFGTVSKTEYDEEREKVLVPVRSRRGTHEEQRPEEPGKERVRQIRRRWYIY